MNRLFQWTIVALLAAMPTVAQDAAAPADAAPTKAEPADAAPAVPLDTEDAKISYFFGTNLGNAMKELPVQLDEKAFLQGVRDTIAGRKPALDETEIQAVMLSLQTKVQAEQAAKQEVIDAKRAEEVPANLKQIESFNSDGAVKTTTSGLKYRTVREGSGAAPLSSDTVEVNYKGMLTDGKVFDSSYDRGESISFPLNRVIAGWTEALQLMKEGGKLEVLIPGALGYGENPPPGSIITPNAPLFFEIELLDVL